MGSGAETSRDVGRRWWRVVVLAGALIAAPTLAGCTGEVAPPAAQPAAAAVHAELTAQGITVEAIGTVTGTPDVLSAIVGVAVDDDSIEDAYRRANAAANDVRQALIDAGVDDADMQTAQLSLHPRHDRDRAVRGYTARTTLRVDLRDLDAAGQIIDAAVGAAGDAATLRSLGFRLDDDDEHVVAAREAAFAEAHAKAEQYAEMADRPLGQLVGLREAASPGQPMTPGRAVIAEDAAAMPAAPPIEPGEAEVHVRIEVTWALD